MCMKITFNIAQLTHVAQALKKANTERRDAPVEPNKVVIDKDTNTRIVYKVGLMGQESKFVVSYKILSTGYLPGRL